MDLPTPFKTPPPRNKYKAARHSEVSAQPFPTSRDCYLRLAGLVLVSVSLLLSLCINIIFFIRQRAVLCRDTDECYDPHSYDGESLNHHEQQENPIYGNISTDSRGSLDVCYDARDCMKSLESDLKYASLDLRVANKHKKRRHHQQGHAQGRNKPQDQLPVHLTSPVNSFFEVETDMEAQRPSRDTSTMVSHSSIYLNSQEMAQEEEDMERERGMSIEREN